MAGGFELAPLDDADRGGDGWELAPIEPEQPSTLRNVALNNPLTAIAETGANLLSQGVALPAAGLAGIGAAAGRSLGLTDADPADVVHKVGGALTYQPRGEMGQAATAAVMAPFEKLAEVGQGAGDWVLDKTGSPAAATVVDTAINAAPMAVVPAWKAGKSATARGLLNHHPTPGPEVLQRLMRISPEEAGRYFEAWRAEKGASDGAKLVREGGDAPGMAPNPIPMPESAGSGLEALRRPGRDDLPGMADQLPGVPAGGWTEAGTGSAAVAGADRFARELRAGERGLAETPAADFASEVLLSDQRGRGILDHRGSRPVDRYSADDATATLAGTEARPGASSDAGVAAIPERFEAPDAGRANAEFAGVGAGSRYQGADLAQSNQPRRSATTDAGIAPDRSAAQDSLARAERILTERGSIAGWIDHYNRHVRDGNTIEAFSRNPDGSHTLRVSNGKAARTVTVPADKLPEYLNALRDPAKVAEIEARNQGDVVLGRKVRELDDATLNQWRGMVSLSDAARLKLEREAGRREVSKQAVSKEVSTQTTPLAMRVDDAAHRAATSPLNDKPQPTPAQIEAGTYAKGHLDLHGLPISIENPKGSVRRGTDASGRTWETQMQHHYGYIKRSAAKDGDHVDVFIGDRPESTRAFVIDQIDPKTGKYDEAKVILGALDEADARRIYQANYEPGWKGLGAITPMEMDAFKGWVKSEASKRPAGLPRVAGKHVTEFDDAALSRLATAPTLSEVARSKVAAEIDRRTASADFPGAPVRAQIGEASAVQDMAASTVQNGTWNPGANYAPFVDQVRAPIANARTVADLPAPKRRERIIRELADALDTHVYEGRVKGKKRLGFFRPANREVRIKNAADIEVAAHELAHLLDNKIPALSAAWRGDKALREQLKSVSYDQKSVTEGFAEAVRLWATQSDVLEAKAPRVFKWLEDFANSHEYGPPLRLAQSRMHAWFEQDGLNRARSKIGDPDKLGNSPIMQHLGDWWKQQRKEWRQSVSDDLAGLYDAERSLTGKIAPAGAYETARLSRSAPSITDGAIRFGAPLRKADGSYTFTGKGLHEILRPVSGRIEDFMLYAVGKSAQELMGQKREHLFSPAEIAAMVKLETPEFRTALNEFQTWNRAIVDYAQAHGVVNAESRAMWNRQIYLPFWRVSQPGEWKGGKVGDWRGVQALSGGTSNIRDVLSNVIGNANLLITKALVNDARARTVKLITENKGGHYLTEIPKESRPVKIAGEQVAEAMLKRYGIAINEPGYFEFMLTNQAPAGSNIIAVLENGKPRYFEVGDPLLFRSLAALERPPQHWLVQWLGLPRRVGQASITLDPTFIARNLARDQVMAGVMSRAGFRPMIDAMSGVYSRIVGDPLYRDWIANGGGLSSLFLDDAALKKNLERFYAGHGINAKTVLDTPAKMLYFVERAGDAIESATRVGEYKRAIERGEHPRHAAYLSRDVSVDWATKGDSKALGVAYETIMFLRAAVVSLDRVYRGIAHDPNRGAIAVKTGAIALASTMLYLMNRGDPRYDDLEDWKKDAFWHVWIGDEHFMMPKAFEVGAVASIAERTAERLLDADPTGLGKDFVRIVGNVFGLNWKPQIIAPIYDQATNKQGLTRTPIETPGMQDLQPAFRAKPHTSETMKKLGQMTGDLPEELQFNPVRAEALLRGYLNAWGGYALMATDALISDGKAPAMRTDQLPVVKGFYANEPPTRTKFENQFYEMLGEAKRLRGTLRELDETGQREWADRKEQHPLAGEAKPLERAAKSLGAINNDMEAVRRDQSLTPAEKREKLDALTVERNALLKDAVLASKAAQQEKAK